MSSPILDRSVFWPNLETVQWFLYGDYFRKIRKKIFSYPAESEPISFYDYFARRMWNRASERIRSSIRRISIIITTIDKKILFTLRLGENNTVQWTEYPLKKYTSYVPKTKFSTGTVVWKEFFIGLRTNGPVRADHYSNHSEFGFIFVIWQINLNPFTDSFEPNHYFAKSVFCLIFVILKS